MFQWMLIAFLVLAGANPLRICTCLDEDEPLVSVVGEEPHPHCDCPVIKPVQKLPATPAAVAADSQFDYLLASGDPILVDAHAVDSVSAGLHRHPSATPLYVTLRTLRN
jgi:hypothetical protein